MFWGFIILVSLLFIVCIKLLVCLRCIFNKEKINNEFTVFAWAYYTCIFHKTIENCLIFIGG